MPPTRGRSKSPRIHSPTRKLRSLSPYNPTRKSPSLSPYTTLDRLEDELRGIELAQRKEIEQWLIQHYKPSEKEIEMRLRAVDIEEEHGIHLDKDYTGYGDEIGETTWDKKENLKKRIAEERAKRRTKGGRKTRRNDMRRR